MAQTVEELAELLDNIKLEADRNAESVDKILKTINNKLDIMAGDTEADDLIKVYLTELKKILEERHSHVVSEFEKIDNSFRAISEEQANLTKTSEMKEMFDIFSSHMQSVASELFTQRELLAKYDERFENFAADKTDKNDIINSVSEIRKDVETVNQGFEASVSDISSNIQSIFKNLIVMDPSAQNDIVRRELENIYIATNSILTALHSVEQKNDDLILNLENFITVEQFEQSQEKIGNLISKADEIADKFIPVAEKEDIERVISKTDEISGKINALPLREDLKYFAEKTSELSSQICSLPQKENLDEISAKTIEGLQCKIEELSVKSELDDLAKQTEEISSKISGLSEKSDIDNMVFQSNQISEKINSLIKKDDFEQLSNKAVTIEQKIDTLPQQGDIADVHKAIHEFSDILDTLRGSLSNANESTSLMIREQLDKLSSILSAVVTENDFAGFRHDLADFVQKIIDNSESLNENLNINKDTLQNLITQIESLDVNKNMETIAVALDGLRITSTNNVGKIIDEVNNVSSKIDNISFSPLEEKITEVYDAIADTNDALKQVNTEIVEKLSDKSDFESVKSSIDSTSDAVNNLLDASKNNVEMIVEEIGKVSAKIEDCSNDVLEEKISDVSSKISQASASIQSLQNEMLEKLSEDDNSEKFSAVNNAISLLQDTVVSSQAANEASLSEKLLSLRDMITTDIVSRDEKFIGIQEKLDEFIANIDKISSASEIKIGNSISEISDLKSEVEHISNTFAEWNYNQEARDSKVVGMISSELSEIGVSITTLQDSVRAGVHQELVKNSETVEQQINKLVDVIENLKSDLLSADNEPVHDYDETFKEIKNKITAVKQEINLVNTDILDVLNEKAEAVIQELVPLKDYMEQFDNLDKTISEKFDEFSDIQEKNIQDIVTEIKSLINQCQQEQSQHLSTENIEKQISESVEDIKTSISEKITSGNEDLKTLISVAMNNDDITWAIDNLRDDLSDKVTRIFNERNNLDDLLEKSDNISDEIIGGNAKIAELLDVLNQKVDVLAMADNNEDYEVLDEINEVKNLISSQRNLLENSASAEKANAIENRLEELITKIDSIDSINSSDLKDSRENIIAAILSVFEQISFIEESEDIKDFVEEKTDEINQSLIEVKQQLNQIVNSDDDYSYTLQDVESDIAKLRLVISELSTASSNEEISDISDNIHRIVSSVEDLQTSLTHEEISGLKSDFEKLSEDILSISSRTNKLILTSDESYNALNSGLNDFSNVIYKLEEQINFLDNTEITERIEHKLDNAISVVTESANSDKVMRQALMYMGEWIDAASENIEGLCESSEKINALDGVIAELQEKMSEQAVLLNKVTERFEEQQERMDRLELKLEKILSAIDDIDDTKLTRKVDKIDRQLAKLGSTIEKLASYVDE